MNHSPYAPLLAVLCLGTATLAQQPVSAPPSLQPAKGQVFLFAFQGQGTQVYSCKDKDGIFAWNLKAPEAKLIGGDGKVVGRHFAGPTWQSVDGSSITGKLGASVPSAESDAIPWLLLTVSAHSGSGTFSRVESVQRLNTAGGIAPAEGCDSQHANAETKVPYKAVYQFYGHP